MTVKDVQNEFSNKISDEAANQYLDAMYEVMPISRNFREEDRSNRIGGLTRRISDRIRGGDLTPPKEAPPAVADAIKRIAAEWQEYLKERTRSPKPTSRGDTTMIEKLEFDIEDLKEKERNDAFRFFRGASIAQLIDAAGRLGVWETKMRDVDRLIADGAYRADERHDLYALVCANEIRDRKTKERNKRLFGVAIV